MDQTGIYYEMPHRSTVHARGAGPVQVQTSGRESMRVTVALTVTSTGERLEPFVVSKGSPGGRISREFSTQNESFTGSPLASAKMH